MPQDAGFHKQNDSGKLHSSGRFCNAASGARMTTKSEGPQPPTPAIPEPILFTRELSGEFNGEKLHYRALAGETFIRDEKAVPVASFFTTAYLKSGVDDVSARPVAFIFNGGP